MLRAGFLYGWAKFRASSDKTQFFRITLKRLSCTIIDGPLEMRQLVLELALGNLSNVHDAVFRIWQRRD